MGGLRAWRLSILRHRRAPYPRGAYPAAYPRLDRPDILPSRPGMRALLPAERRPGELRPRARRAFRPSSVRPRVRGFLPWLVRGPSPRLRGPLDGRARRSHASASAREPLLRPRGRGELRDIGLVGALAY